MCAFASLRSWCTRSWHGWLTGGATCCVGGHYVPDISNLIVEMNSKVRA